MEWLKSTEVCTKTKHQQYQHQANHIENEKKINPTRTNFSVYEMYPRQCLEPGYTTTMEYP